MFSNGCKYPADPSGRLEEIYNCRCTLIPVVKGLEPRAYKYRDTSAIEGMSYEEWQNAKAKSNPITLPEEKGRAIKQSYLNEYIKNGNMSQWSGAHSSDVNLQRVFYNESAQYKVEIPDYSAEINESLSEAARMVAELGSKHGYEYSALVDINSGKITYMGTSKEKDSVKSYQKYLEKHPNKMFAMVHNHPSEALPSYADIQELATFRNMDSLVATPNNGLTYAIKSNGYKTNDYMKLEGKYAKYYRDALKDGADEYGAIQAMAREAIKDFGKGGIIIHDGRK